MNIEMGNTYSDLVTGFKGVCTGIVQYLTGCTQVLLVPKTKQADKYAEGHWFDYTRLKPTTDTKVVLPDAGDAVLDPGGPTSDLEASSRY